VLPRPAVPAATPGVPALGSDPGAVAAAAAAAQVSVRGAVSIQVYGLNRLGLVQDRTRILRRLDFLGLLVIELGEVIDSLAGERKPRVISDAVKRLRLLQNTVLDEIRRMAEPDAPYSAMVVEWIRAFKKRVAR
jgi:hypothetical protein